MPIFFWMRPFATPPFMAKDDLILLSVGKPGVRPLPLPLLFMPLPLLAGAVGIAPPYDVLLRDPPVNGMGLGRCLLAARPPEEDGARIVDEGADDGADDAPFCNPRPPTAVVSECDDSGRPVGGKAWSVGNARGCSTNVACSSAAVSNPEADCEALRMAASRNSRSSEVKSTGTGVPLCHEFAAFLFCTR